MPFDPLRQAVGPWELEGNPLSPGYDAFGKFRVSNPFTLFDSKQVGGDDAQHWGNRVLAGTGTFVHSVNRSSTIMTATSVNSHLIRQSYRWMTYQPGKGQTVEVTFNFNPIQVGETKSVGAFFGTDGLYFRVKDGVPAFVVRSSVSGSMQERVFTRDMWQIDKLDGTGPSREKIDLTKVQLLHIDYEWYSVGGIRFGFVFGNKLVYCLFVDNVNNLSSAYMKVPNLPIRYELITNANTSSATMEAICCSVVSEGGREDNGHIFSVDRDVTPIRFSSANILYPVIAIRINPALPFVAVKPRDFTFFTDDAAVFVYRLYLNPVFAGTALDWQPVNGSYVQSAVMANTTTISVGANTVSRGSGYSKQNAGGNGPTMPIASSDDGLGVDPLLTSSDVLCVAGKVITGNNVDVWGAISWLESR